MNTEVMHTPGPWEAHISDVRGTLCVVAAGTWICGEIWNDVAPLPEREAKANAHLISAAPELFEALDMARRYMKTCLGSSFWDGPNPYPIIDAALAKARGEVNA
nr:hypothetical protein [Brucella intermedia]